MNLLDYFYNEFVSFCEEFNAVAAINNAWLKSHGFDLGCRQFVISVIEPGVINNTIHWSSNPAPSGTDWSDLNALWSERCWKIGHPDNIAKVKKEYSDPITVYYVTDRNYHMKYDDEVRDTLYDIRPTTFREIDLLECNFQTDAVPEYTNIPGQYVGIIINYPTWLFQNVVTQTEKLVFKELPKNNIIHVTSNFLSAIASFPAALACIYELGYDSKINYLDIDTTTGNVSYLPVDKTLKSDFDINTVYTNSNRKVTTIGKLLNKFNRSDYISKCDMERISTFFSGFKTDLNVEIWDSDRISEAYLFSNYADELTCIVSTLHKSCMRYEECQPYFEFYEKAEAKIAVALDSNKRICARALLWQIDDNLYYLDRIYSNSPFIIVKFAKTVAEKYPIKYYRVDRKLYDIATHMEVTIWPNYVISRKNLINYHGPFPYVDTFNVFNPFTGELWSSANVYNLHETNGNYLKI